MGAILGISQASVVKFERGANPLPKKAYLPLTLLRQGYPATPENGNRLSSARARLNVTPEALADALATPLEGYQLMEEGEQAIPWSVFGPLALLERERGLVPTFDPAAEAARYLATSPIPFSPADLGLFARLGLPDSTGPATPQQEAAYGTTDEDALVEAKNAARVAQLKAEWAAKAEREKARATPAPEADDIVIDDDL
jgi:hypothetical protein